MEPRLDESRRIMARELEGRIEIQCGECGSEYEQPARYPFRFCVVCGAPFAIEDEIIIELPWLI
jgi:rRNA maturation endonuclease Nob1